MPLPLLATKLYIPPVRTDGIARPRLTDKIRSSVDSPGVLVLLSGPAGFGKTTLLSEFVAQLHRPAAWLSLDEGDNDPIRFWTYLIAACQAVQQWVGESALAMLGMPQPLSAEAVPAVLINDIARLEHGLVLILDDYHAIQNEAIHSAFSFLLEHLPGNLHILVSTRVDPPWPLARFRARGQLVEIRASDLRFSVEEAAAFLNRLMKLNLTIEDVQALDTRTEGWIAGLQLAAIALRSPLSRQGRSDVAGFIKSFTGSHVYIAEYLLEEVFKSQAADTQSFLLKTSILGRLSASLCEAVTGCADGQSVLLALQRANLFVVPLDDEGRWFRYHQLFADLLKARLQQTTPAPAICDLHQRAANWYRGAGMDSDAIDHALAAGNYPYVLEIMERVALPMILQAHVRTFDGWLRAIPPEFLQDSPKINLACAWMYLVRGAPDLAGPYLGRLEKYFARIETEKVEAALQGGWLALQAKRLNMQGKSQESIRLASQALDMLPEAELNVRTLVQLELATAYQQLADYDQAAGIFQMIARDAQARGDFVSELLGISARARMTLLQGKLHLTYQIAREGLDHLEAAGKFTPFSATLFGEIGQVFYHWHRLDQAQEYLLRSVQMSGHSGYIDPEMFYHLMRSLICQMEGDWRAAELEMQKINELMRLAPPAMIRESIIAQQLRVDLAFDRFQEAQATLEKEGFRFDPDTGFSGPFGLLYNSALRFLLSLARSGRVKVNLSRLVEIAGATFEELLRWQQIPVALESLLLRSQMYAALGDEVHRLEDISRALEIAGPEGFISVFVEEGQPVADALATLLKKNRPGTVDPAFLQEIRTAFPGRRSEREPVGGVLASQVVEQGSVPVPLIEPLTARELQVLKLIAAGDSNRAIAEQLVITVSAVKKHTGNIFGKLGVNSRTQAVARARQLGLLIPGE